MQFVIMAIEYHASEKENEQNVNIETAAQGNVKNGQWIRSCSAQYLLLITLLSAAILASIITLVVLLLRHQPVGDSYQKSEASAPDGQNTLSDGHQIATAHHLDDEDYRQSSLPNVYSIDPNATFTIPDKLKIVTRLEWVAQPPTETPTPLELPVPYVIIHHTLTENCSDIATCMIHVRYIQSFHMDSRGWWDIGYNWLVGGDGNAYEGRGWRNQGAHTYGYNVKSIGIALIGTFNNYLPPAVQIKAAKQLIEIGVEKGYIAKNYKLLGLRQLLTSQSPGLMLYEDIKTWPHWSEEP